MVQLSGQKVTTPLCLGDDTELQPTKYLSSSAVFGLVIRYAQESCLQLKEESSEYHTITRIHCYTSQACLKV